MPATPPPAHHYGSLGGLFRRPPSLRVDVLGLRPARVYASWASKDPPRSRGSDDRGDAFIRFECSTWNGRITPSRSDRPATSPRCALLGRDLKKRAWAC